MAWEFAEPVHMCFVDLQKAYDHVPQGHPVGGEVLREHGVDGPLLGAVPVPKKYESGFHSSKLV